MRRIPSDLAKDCESNSEDNEYYFSFYYGRQEPAYHVFRKRYGLIILAWITSVKEKTNASMNN